MTRMILCTELGTMLVDYGPSMDGFSPTYKHVMPGCSQGNTVWYLRDFATYRESLGNKTGAARLRELAAAVASETMQKMYTSHDGVGFFNVIFPPAATTPNLTVYEMRHVVDFFSVTFGLCGLSDQPCDFLPQQRRELASWFRSESVTKTWIRATSPKTNCSRQWTIPINASAAEASMAHAALAEKDHEEQMPSESWPAYVTCQADRPDHGSNGAYPSWPAFAVEALCYLDGNCSSAFTILSSFADNTYEVRLLPQIRPASAR